jgi:hypothetical protein
VSLKAGPNASFASWIVARARSIRVGDARSILTTAFAPETTGGYQGTAKFSWENFIIKDRMKLSGGGQLIHDTKCVGGSGTKDFPPPGSQASESRSSPTATATRAAPPGNSKSSARRSNRAKAADDGHASGSMPARPGQAGRYLCRRYAPCGRAGA